MDHELVVELCEALIGKLGLIVINNLLGHSKAVDHMVFDEFNCIRHFDISHGGSFSPFIEVINYHPYKPMPFGQGQSTRTINIHWST